MAIELRKGDKNVAGYWRHINEPSVGEVIEWLTERGATFDLALHRFNGGMWEFHAIDGPEDGAATHRAFAIDIGGDDAST